jgi:hypothetical protein
MTLDQHFQYTVVNFHVVAAGENNAKSLFIAVNACFSWLNPHQNDQGRKRPCYFQRLIALKCLKCQKIKKNI